MTIQKRKICFVTGTRADFGILSPVIQATQNSAKLEPFIIATGMHLLPKFGSTYKEIEKTGFSLYKKINTADRGDTGREMADSVGKAILGFSKTFSRLKPDFVVVLGDRGEMMAAAITANYLTIPVAHIHGGEVSGHVDGLLRHAITKLSHLHFAATSDAGKRIIKLGEEPWRVYLSGAPALDRILREKLPDKIKLFKKYGFDPKKPLALLVQHPVLNEAKDAGWQIETSLKSILELKIPLFVIYPNSDAGSQEMIKIIEKYRDYPDVKISKSIPHLDYLALLKSATFLVGNSSSGIIEAPSFKLPVVNIGSRQANRERGQNILDAGYSKEEIKEAINKIVSGDKIFREKLSKCQNPYGNGRASQKIIKVLEEIKIDDKLINKQITY